MREEGRGLKEQKGRSKKNLPRPPLPPRPHSLSQPKSNWYLGIDFGSTMLSAALLNREKREIYPIYWKIGGQNLQSECFRMPTVVCLLAGKIVAHSVGFPQSSLPDGKLLLQNFKPYLKVGMTYLSSGNSGEVGNFEPILQWSKDEEISLSWLLDGLRSLLATLKPGMGEKNIDLQAHFFDRESADRVATFPKLGGVILGTPAFWSDAYRHNLREVVLSAGLVTESSDIFVIEDAIATLLSELTPNLGESKNHNSTSKIAPGGTLIINSGAVTTEIALVNLPENPEKLTYSDFTCQSFAYAGNALDQDIICQLLCPDEFLGKLNELPRAGYADVAARYKLQQHLQSHPLGQELLAAAANLKIVLQEEDSFKVEIEGDRWEVKKRDLESKVLVPFVQQLNREVNTLLSRVGMSTVAINQAICVGGNGSWLGISRWLRQKLPNAIVIRDRDTNIDTNIKDISPSLKSKIGWVAWGLATLPLYPQILDTSRHQYSDYFLLWELMQALGMQTLSINEITQTLEHRGINTRVCLPRILAILDGELPGGLLASETDIILLTEKSRQNPELTMIEAAPIFNQDRDRKYHLNQPQAKYLQEYISKLMATSHQKLEEPLFQSLVLK
ncbi:hypothetical protein BCD67_16320 [Oscillatoriales cyanobacterium USR001]|nr:hypothetical protein BCD67_16320 [Oscillatoriales cyanobacterium USR001]